MQRCVAINDKAPVFTAKAVINNQPTELNFNEFINEKWCLLFSQPAAFTPVGSSDLMEIERMMYSLKRKNVVVAVIVPDIVEKVTAWIKDVCTIMGVETLSFPIICDEKRDYATLYSMIDRQTPQSSVTRSCVLIDVNKNIRFINHYPRSIGRGTDEIMRVVDAMQCHDACDRIAMPANWRMFQSVFVHPRTTTEEARKIYPELFEMRPYLRSVEMPRKFMEERLRTTMQQNPVLMSMLLQRPMLMHQVIQNPQLIQMITYMMEHIPKTMDQTMSTHMIMEMINRYMMNMNMGMNMNMPMNMGMGMMPNNMNMNMTTGNQMHMPNMMFSPVWQNRMMMMNDPMMMMNMMNTPMTNMPMATMPMHMMQPNTTTANMPAWMQTRMPVNMPMNMNMNMPMSMGMPFDMDMNMMMMKHQMTPNNTMFTQPTTTQQPVTCGMQQQRVNPVPVQPDVMSLV